MPAVDLRALVKTPIALTGSFAEPKSPHPIHNGIHQTRQYASPSAAPIGLPVNGRGLERLKTAIHSPVSGMTPERSLEAHVRMLADAPFCHIEAGTAIRGPDGAPLESDDATLTRSVLLAAVFSDPDEQFVAGEISAPRFAAVATLTVQTNVHNKRVIDDAWLTVGWAHSTRTMVELLLGVPGLHLEAPKINRRIEILIAEDLVAEAEGLPGEIERMTMLLGGKPEVHVVNNEDWSIVASKIRANNPFELIVLGPVEERVVAEFTRRHGERNLHRASVTSADRATAWLLDQLPTILGVTPGFMSFPQAEAMAGRPRMPVRRPVKCLHHGNNYYVLDAESGEWWTRDFAQHGQNDKSIFKTFQKIDGDLHWQSDRDADGELITDKHKGAEGNFIDVSDTGSCGHPASHLT